MTFIDFGNIYQDFNNSYFIVTKANSKAGELSTGAKYLGYGLSIRNSTSIGEIWGVEKDGVVTSIFKGEL